MPMCIDADVNMLCLPLLCLSVCQEEDGDDLEEGQTVLFKNSIVDNAIPPEFINACAKGTVDACKEGRLVGHAGTGQGGGTGEMG